MGRIVLRVLLGCILTAVPVEVVRAATTEPYRIDASFAYQLEGVTSLAGSGFTTARGTVGAGAFDFHVMNLPMKSAEPPSIHVLGDVSMARRTIAIATPAASI